MPIYASNLKLVAAATMDDTPANGGLPSSTEIVDGGSNGVFPDVSEADRLGGLQFRKVHLSVDSDSTDTFQGVNSVITKVPADAATSIVMFPAASAAETQADMVQRLGVFTGTMTQSQLDAISTEMFLLGMIDPNTVVYDPWRDNQTAPPLPIGAGGAAIFEVTDALASVAASHFVVGAVVTLVDFYEGVVVRAESRQIASMMVRNGSFWYNNKKVVLLEFTDPSVYPAWGGATKYWDVYGVGEQKFGTYVIESALTSSLKKFEFYSATQTTAALSAGATSIPVLAITAGIVPEALMADPNASDVLGFPPTLLTKNPDGREPIFKQYRRAVIGKDVTFTGAVSAAQVVDLGEIDLTWVRVTGADGTKIATGFTVDLDAGTVTFSSVVGMVQPVTVTGRAEDMFQISAIAGTTLAIPTSRPLRRAYPAGSTVSSALMHGDCRARVLALNARASWLATWAATLAGSPATAVFDAVHHPLVVANAGTVTDRVRIGFSNSTTFTAISENFGVLGTGSTGADYAPLNPSNNKPFFTLPAAGWGGGWSAGNQLLIDLEGAQKPLWLLRCIQMSPNTLDAASFEIANRGHVDRA